MLGSAELITIRNSRLRVPSQFIISLLVCLPPIQDLSRGMTPLGASNTYFQRGTYVIVDTPMAVDEAARVPEWVSLLEFTTSC